MEAHAREGPGQAKDLKYSQLLLVLDDKKIKHSCVITGYRQGETENREETKGPRCSERKLDAVYEELATERKKAEKKQQDNIRLVRIIKYYEHHQLKIIRKHKPS